MSTCLLIAVYNNPETIVGVVEECLRSTRLEVLVIDDGSDTPVAELLEQNTYLREQRVRWSIERHTLNRGKGEALKTGFRLARERGFAHALTLDGDGQHYPGDMPLVLQAARFSQDEILLGERHMDSSNSPFISRLGRAISDFWIWCFTGKSVRDSQCGVRLYPLATLAKLELTGSRYDFEMEALVRLLWAGVECRSVKIRVLYPERRVSHFHKLFDNFRIALANGRLLRERVARGFTFGAKADKSGNRARP